MQIIVMLIFFLVWLLVLWLGSIALEATGLERKKARFQTLSALTGTGFTTGEAESVVNHPERRRIATWLIFIGNAGVISFIIALILYVRAGLITPSIEHVGIVVITLLIIGLLIGLKVIDGFTGAIIRMVRRGRPAKLLQADEIPYQLGDYQVAQLTVKEKAEVSGIQLMQRGIKLLAIKRGDEVLALPDAGEPVAAGDKLLCFGKASEIDAETR